MKFSQSVTDQALGCLKSIIYETENSLNADEKAALNKANNKDEVLGMLPTRIQSKYSRIWSLLIKSLNAVYLDGKASMTKPVK